MKRRFDLYRNGFVANYLVAGPVTEPFEAPFTLKDQLEFESRMREIYYSEPAYGYAAPKLMEKSVIGEDWRYYTDNRNIYVDFSKFYFTLTRVTFLASTELVCDCARTVRARVWSYAAFDMWCRGVRVATEKVPVYQPIRYTDVTLELLEGENEIYFYVQNFGVRDTRNMIALQILDTDGITVSVAADEDALDTLGVAEDWFSGLCASDGKIKAPFSPDFEVTALCDGEKRELSASSEMGVPKGTFSLTLSATVLGHNFKRTLHFFENQRPVFKKRGDLDRDRANNAQILENSSYTKLSGEERYRREGHGVAALAITHVINNGMKADEHTYADIREMAKSILRRSDCADFELLSLLWLMKRVELPAEYREIIKDAALKFRYWMDEEGADAMCFWSENHALTFYTCQMIAGELFADEVFLRSGRRGSEQRLIGLRRIGEWFDLVEVHGFEEFCAGGYMGVTVVALLAVQDFSGDAAISARAAAVIDRIVRVAALHTFDGVHFAPMGRVYRGSLTPHISSLQSLLYYISDNNAYSVGARVSPIGVSDYDFPSGITDLMSNDADEVYSTGRAEVHLKKTKNYILTSVASPRESAIPSFTDTDSEYYRTTVMNEGFHGTTLFTPGGFGYQQHLWYAAISDSFFTFVTLPGSERDLCSMRPGYWYGNLVFPALRQTGRELWCYYELPDSIPTRFTHAYFPRHAADEIVEDGEYKFARVGDGYLALWCSEPMIDWECDAVVRSDIRAYGDRTCWYVRVGSKAEDGSFAEFISQVKSIPLTRDYVARVALNGK